MKILIIFSTFLFIVFSFSFALEYIVPDIPYGLTSADIDLDGDIDVIVGSRNNTAQDTISIFINNGFCYFDIIYLEKEILRYLYCVKIDEDSYPDLVTKILDDYQIVYYANEGNANFGNAIPIHTTLSDHLEYIRICDMNNDGIEDIVFYEWGGYDQGYWGILENDGFGNFEETVYYSSDANITGFEVGNINEDEYPDIIITTSQYGTIIFYNNINSFIQEDFYPNCYHSPFIFDMNSDSLNDIGIFEHHEFPNSVCKLRIFYNNGNNTFSLPDTLLFPGGTLIKNIADYNNDGFPDITYFRYLYTGPIYSIYVCLNNTNGTFADPVEYCIGNPLTLRIISADLDANNYLDLIISGYKYDDNLYRIKMLYNDGTGNFLDEPQVGVIENCILNIEDCKLSNYPNPFNPTTTISFELNTEDTELIIYNIKGQKIKTFPINSTTHTPLNSIIWDGTDNYRKPVSSGIYLYRLKADNYVSATKKMLLLK